MSEKNKSKSESEVFWEETVDELIRNLTPNQQVAYFEGQFLEYVARGDDFFAAKIFDYLTAAYREQYKSSHTIDVRDKLLNHTVELIAKFKVIDKTVSPLTGTKIKLFQHLLSFWGRWTYSKISVAAFREVEKMYSRASKQEKDKMTPLIYAHISTFSGPPLRMWLLYAIDELGKIILTALLRGADPDFLKKQKILEAIFKDVDVLQLTENQIVKLNEVIHEFSSVKNGTQ